MSPFVVVLKPREALEAFNFPAPGVGEGSLRGGSSPGVGIQRGKAAGNVPVLGADSADLGWDLPREVPASEGQCTPHGRAALWGS